MLFGSKLHCKFGSVRETILTCAYKLHITYPYDNIVVHANYHPDVIGAFSYIMAEYLFFKLGLAFGNDSSPTFWEAMCQI